MMGESNKEKFIRGIVKFVFILCYIAFMWASIHKVAYFFSNFESDSGNTWGSYSLAGAFDITALITTIGLMFFRKSMPTKVQVGIGAFIVVIALFSYVVNWEYDAHFQSTALTLQATGKTIAIFDSQHVVQYVPEMQINTTLMNINPFLASGFTIFSLIYSVIAEFFGTKPPTLEELQERKKFLAERSGILQEIKQLENTGNNTEKGVIQQIGDNLAQRVLDKVKPNTPPITPQQKVVTITEIEEQQPQQDTEVTTTIKTRTTQPLDPYKKLMEREDTYFETGEDKLAAACAFLSAHPQATDQELADYLNMKRVASARFWRLKAETALEPTTDKQMVTPEPPEEVINIDWRKGTCKVWKGSGSEYEDFITAANMAQECNVQERRIKKLVKDGQLETRGMPHYKYVKKVNVEGPWLFLRDNKKTIDLIKVKCSQMEKIRNIQDRQAI